MARSGERQPPGRVLAFVYAVLVHLAIIGVVVTGFHWTSPPTATAIGPVKATLVEDPQKQQLEEERRRREAQKREQERQAAEAQKRTEDDAKRKADAERKQKEDEARRVAEQKRIEEQKRVAEQKRVEEQKRQEEARQKAEAERQRQAEVKRKQEEERAKAEAEARRKQAEESLRQQLAQEEQSREQAQVEAARAARAASAKNQYETLIKQKVSRNWSRPPNAAAGLKCVVRVRLVPGGDVVQATVVRGSGDAAFDRSVEAAVYKAAPLPLPRDADLFEYFREIEFIFDPSREKA